MSEDTIASDRSRTWRSDPLREEQETLEEADYTGAKNAKLFLREPLGAIEIVDPGSTECKALGDLGPEGVLFISEAKAPISPKSCKSGETDKASLLSVTNEVSGTTTFYRIDQAQR